MALVTRKKKAVSPAFKAVLKTLDSAAKAYGLREVKSAATRWVNGQRDKFRLSKERAALEKQLAEVTKRLGG